MKQKTFKNDKNIVQNMFSTFLFLIVVAMKIRCKALEYTYAKIEYVSVRTYLSKNRIRI